MSPSERLEKAIAKASKNLGKRDCTDPEDIGRIEFIAGYSDNRAPIRLLLACTLAKLDNPASDPRKPYTEIGTPDCFSGRRYDEKFIGAFVVKHRLPCNATTAFLTPGFRNFNRSLNIDVPPSDDRKSCIPSYSQSSTASQRAVKRPKPCYWIHFVFC